MIISDAKNNSNTQSEEVLREWRESAFYWQKHLGTIRTMFQPVTQALIDEAGIVAGQSVLDVAGGSGEPSLTIAQIVGTTGSVTCTDIIAEMVAAAEGEAKRRGLSNMKFRQCGADSLPFDANLFDAVVCRMGAMFFPDPLAALREMLRVTKPQGSIGFVVWDKSEVNPYFHVISSVIARHFKTEAPADPLAPGAFRFAERGSLARILRDAGAVDVKESPLKFHMAAPVSRNEFWEMRSETSGTVRDKLATLSSAERELIAAEVMEDVGEFFPDEQMRFPARMIIVSGKKP